MIQKTVLVTGGAGFIGSHLVDRLISLGHRVVVVDDLSSGRLHNLDRAAVFYHTSINNPSVEEIVRNEQPDIIAHHAAQVSISESVRDPIRDAEINIQGTLRLIEISRRFGVGKFIFASSGGALYGEPDQNPCSEQHPVRPISPYGLSKFSAEGYLGMYHNIYRLPYVALRYGNVYGPRQDPHGEAGVVAIFARAMLEGKQPRIFGSGLQERDFIYVDDVIDANIAAMDEGQGEYNVGTGAATSVSQIFDMLKGILKYKWTPTFGPAKPGEVFSISLDSTKLQREMGWMPKLSLEQGLAQTVDHLRSALKGTTVER